MPSNNLIICCPLLLLPPIPSSIRVFSNESTLLHMRWPKYWSLSFNVSPSNEHLGLISFNMDWSALHAVQGTLKSLLQHHSSEAFRSLLIVCFIYSSEYMSVSASQSIPSPPTFCPGNHAYFLRMFCTSVLKISSFVPLFLGCTYSYDMTYLEASILWRFVFRFVWCGSWELLHPNSFTENLSGWLSWISVSCFSPFRSYTSLTYNILYVNAWDHPSFEALSNLDFIDHRHKFIHRPYFMQVFFPVSTFVVYM